MLTIVNQCRWLYPLLLLVNHYQPLIRHYKPLIDHYVTIDQPLISASFILLTTNPKCFSCLGSAVVSPGHVEHLQPGTQPQLPFLGLQIGEPSESFSGKLQISNPQLGKSATAVEASLVSNTKQSLNQSSPRNWPHQQEATR